MPACTICPASEEYRARNWSRTDVSIAEKSGTETDCNPERLGGFRRTTPIDGAGAARASFAAAALFDRGPHAPASVVHATATATCTNLIRVIAPRLRLASEQSTCRLRLQTTLRHCHRASGRAPSADRTRRRGRRVRADRLPTHSFRQTGPGAIASARPCESPRRALPTCRAS